MTYKLGKLAPKFDERTLKMATYLPAALAPPPPEYTWMAMVDQWNMMQNDVLGNCTCASAGHMIRQWTKYAGEEIITPDKKVVEMYRKVSGYRPGHPETDRGAVMLDVLSYWRKKGLNKRKIVAYAILKTKSLLELKQAIYLFGNCYLGVELPVSAQGQDVWAMPSTLEGDGAPGSWGGHAVPAMAYGQGEKKDLISFVSWGKVMHMTEAFYKTYVSEAYAVVSKDWIEADGTTPTPTSLNLQALLSDLAKVATPV